MPRAGTQTLDRDPRACYNTFWLFIARDLFYRKDPAVLERMQLAPGVYLTTLPADKFKRCRITIHLRFPALRASATDTAVLALVLERGYAACPDMTRLSRRLAALYGAELGVDLAVGGVDRVLTADICGIKDEYALAGENLTEAYAGIVLGVLFDPHLVDGVFDPEAVRIEKETLARRLQAEYNNKRLYCVRQARRRFYGHGPAAIEVGGYLKDLPAVTPATLKAEYDRILQSARIDVTVQGADAARIGELLLQKLGGVPRAPQPYAPPLAMPRQAPAHYREAIPGLTQAKLCMLFTTGTPEPLPDIHLLRLAMCVYGGGPTSRLFRNVREKQSLCYYCAASAQSATGSMLVDSGVEPGGEERAEQAILRELRALQDTPPTPDELEDARRALLSGMDAASDSLAAQESWYYGQILRGEEPIDPAEAQARTRAVTAQAVQAELQRYTLSVSYIVTAGEGNDNG